MNVTLPLGCELTTEQHYYCCWSDSVPSNAAGCGWGVHACAFGLFRCLCAHKHVGMFLRVRAWVWVFMCVIFCHCVYMYTRMGRLVHMFDFILHVRRMCFCLWFACVPVRVRVCTLACLCVWVFVRALWELHAIWLPKFERLLVTEIYPKRRCLDQFGLTAAAESRYTHRHITQSIVYACVHLKSKNLKLQNSNS